MNPPTCHECGVDITRPEDGKRWIERVPSGVVGEFLLCWYCEEERKNREECVKEHGL